MSSPSFPRRLLPFLLLTLTLGVGASACSTVPPVIQPATDCRTYVPDSLRQPVKSAPIPQGQVTVGDVMTFGVQQTGQLDKANTRGDTILKAVDACSEANAVVGKKLTKHHFLGL